MGSSYLPSGVLINCTLMTVAKPQNLGVSRKRTTTRTSENAVILNIDDKKISLTFACKSPAKFWDGLGSLCAGIAIGLVCIAAVVVIAAAVVATGGVAAVVLAAMAEAAVSTVTATIIAGAAVASVAAPIKGYFAQKHECDCSLSEASKWKNPHPKVKVNGKLAVLQDSFIRCTKGGLIQPFIDSVIAHEVASKFSYSNDKELEAHNDQQFYMGFVLGFTTLADPLGTAIVSYFAITEYNEGFNDNTLAKEDSTDKEDYLTDKKNAIVDNAVGTGAGLANGAKDVAAPVVKQTTNIFFEVFDQGASIKQAWNLTAFGEKTFIGEFGKKGLNIGVGLGAGVGFGLAGAVANHYIGKSYKEKKRKLIEGVLDLDTEMREKDAMHTLSITANNYI